MKKNIIAIGISVVLIFLLIIIGNILTIGSHLSVLSPYLAYFFYGLISFLIISFLIIPLVKVLRKKEINLDVLNKGYDKDQKKIELLAKKIRDSGLVSDEEQKLLEAKIELKSDLELMLKGFYGDVNKRMTGLILQEAKKVFLYTILSPNSKLDGLIVLFYNVRLVHSLSLKLGYRPSIKRLSLLYINVFMTYFFAMNTEDISEEFGENLEDFLPGIIPGFVPTVVTSSVLQTMMVLQVGFLTKHFLFSPKSDKKSEVRKRSRTEAKNNLKIILKETWDVAKIKVDKLTNA